jgi:hypothetical protein
MARPSSTAPSILEKLSSASTISAANLATDQRREVSWNTQKRDGCVRTYRQFPNPLQSQSKLVSTQARHLHRLSMRVVQERSQGVAWITRASEKAYLQSGRDEAIVCYARQTSVDEGNCETKGLP